MEINTKDFETREDATVVVNPRRTNGDAIRSMSDEELAEFFSPIIIISKRHFSDWLQRVALTDMRDAMRREGEENHA